MISLTRLLHHTTENLIACTPHVDSARLFDPLRVSSPAGRSGEKRGVRAAARTGGSRRFPGDDGYRASRSQRQVSPIQPAGVHGWIRQDESHNAVPSPGHPARWGKYSREEPYWEPGPWRSAASGALLYERGLANRLLYATAAAVPAATLASLGLKRDGPLVVSTRGVEVPGKTLLSAWGTTKTAGKMSVLTAAGMFAPAGLALDYGYNWWRYGRRGIHPESELGSVGRVLHRAGKYSLVIPL